MFGCVESKRYLEKLERCCEEDGWSLMVMLSESESRGKKSRPPSSAGSYHGFPLDHELNAALVFLKRQTCFFCSGWKELPQVV